MAPRQQLRSQAVACIMIVSPIPPRTPLNKALVRRDGAPPVGRELHRPLAPAQPPIRATRRYCRPCGYEHRTRGTTSERQGEYTQEGRRRNRVKPSSASCVAYSGHSLEPRSSQERKRSMGNTAGVQGSEAHGMPLSRASMNATEVQAGIGAGSVGLSTQQTDAWYPTMQRKERP